MTVTDPQMPLKPPLGRPPKELLSSSSHLLKRLGWVVKERAAGAFESTGLSPYHYAVLALLDELEERSLIDRRRDPSDRRRHLVSLTSEGRRALKRLRSVVKRVDEDFLAPLDDEQREALHALLLLLASHHEPRYAVSERSDGS